MDPARYLLALGPLLIAVNLGAPAAIAQDVNDVDAQPWIGQPAPAFDLERVSGGSLKLEDLRGKTVVIHFGTSW